MSTETNSTKDAIPESATADFEEAARSVQARITECLTRAVKIYCDEAESQVVRDVTKAYLYTLCRERPRFLLAALQYLRGLNLDLPTAGRYCLPELIVQTPARWEFEHVDVFGVVSDALSCAGRYRTCSSFVAVHPVQTGDPLICDLEPMRIPMRHKPTSPWFIAFRRRRHLKDQLGSRCRALVGHARKLTKREFLEEFSRRPTPVELRRHFTSPSGKQTWAPDPNKRITHVEAHELLSRTGYTPEEFWREVRKPNTVIPHKPQLEFAL